MAKHRRLVTIARFVLLAALVAGLFGLLPQLGGVTREAAALRHARPALIVASIVAQGLSLAIYALLYRSVLASLGAKVRLRPVVDVIMASFLVSHLAPFGSAAGSLVNVSAMEAQGVGAETSGEGIALTTLVSTSALITLFGVGLLATAGHHVSRVYLAAGGAALVFVVMLIAGTRYLGSHPALAGRAGTWAGRVIKRLRHSVDPGDVGQNVSRLASRAGTALTGRAFGVSFGFAAGNLLFDLLSLDLMFLALGRQPGLGPLTVAYGAANILSAIPLTPGGLGVVEVTLVAITVGFGTPKATAVLAVLGYRLVEFWLPLLPGAAAYLRLRLRHEI
jgi:uncharacterized protein (TIRG00374 family)